MKMLRSIGPAAMAAVVLVACGGGGDGDQSPRVTYSKLVVFGDSLSDVGTYETLGVQEAGGGYGGKYTVNSPDGKIWVELLAKQLGVAAPCAARTGLESSGPLVPLAAPIVDVAGCYGYAEGGSRITNPVGVANKALIALGNTDGYLGQLTDPLLDQFNRHLTAAGGQYAGDELVTVLGGGNDVFLNLAAVAPTVQALVAAGLSQADATSQATTAALAAMSTAATELVDDVKTLVLAKGATHVVVVNVPDISQTPYVLVNKLSADTQGLIQLMCKTFNDQLVAGLKDTPGVLLVDAYTQGQDQTAHPAQYGLTNVTDLACDTTKMAFKSSLVCSPLTLISGDVSRYEYADTVHPTPYGYQLLEQFVSTRMLQKGWL